MLLFSLYKKLFSKFGEQCWWPVTGKGETIPSYRPRKRLTEKQKFEVCAGAILAQNTAWGNASRALGQLQGAKMLSCRAIAKSPRKKIAMLVLSSGYYNQKAER